MALIYQHERIRIDELEGAPCEAFLCVHNEQTCDIGPLYLLVRERWHRFYLDAGLLFWEEGLAPDHDDDLLGDDAYLDLAAKLNVEGIALTNIEMRDGELRVEFENAARLTLYHGVKSDFTTIRECVTAKKCRA